MIQYNSNTQRGAAHLLLVIALVALLVGVLGFVGYNTWQKQNANAGGEGTLAVSKGPAAALGLACSATFDGIRNNDNTAYGKVTIKNLSDNDKKVKITVRVDPTSGHPLAWFGEGNAATEWVVIPANSTKTRSWATGEYVHKSKNKHVIRVVAVWKLRNPSKGLYVDKEISCGQKKLFLYANGQLG